MAFANSPSPTAFGGNAKNTDNAPMQTGPDLPEISTEGFGFQTIAGEAKVRLLPSPWPSENLPPPTASLLDVASRKGLLAAAGPESVVVASTDAVRQAYTGTSNDGNIKPFTPQLILTVGMRVSQVAFSADEKFLVLSAQNGGGLAVYEVANLMNGDFQSAFELSTNSIPLRHLVPNPTAEKAELLALVTENGHLMMAHLTSRQLLSGPQGPVLKEGVSSASWSTFGKHLVAGLGDGTCVQMTPQGEAKAVLPRPSNIEGDQHVSSILWLENDVFLVAHTPSSHEAGSPPMTSYTLITRSKVPENGVMFQKLPELCPPFGLDRATPYQFMQRLRVWDPNLSDAIVVASTGSEDIGLITRSKVPLTDDLPEDQINVFTTTAMADDSRRAQMPMTEDLSSTSPIGVAIDLSSKDKVVRPLPKEEFDDSAGPLPALLILNNEGVLMTWWMVYADSIRKRTSYSGLAAVGGSSPSQSSQDQRQASPFASAGQQSAPGFGQNTFGRPSTPQSTFGSATAFSKPSSQWSNTSSTTPAAPTFGKPTFGTSTPMGGSTSGPTFGQTGDLGRFSPWGASQAGAAATSGATFGQTGSLGVKSNPFAAVSSAAPFGSTSNTAGSSSAPSGGFASFAAQPSGFLSAGPALTGSVFGQSNSGSAFGSAATSGSSFGQMPQTETASKSGFGSGSGFTLGSTFKPDGTAANDASKPTQNAGGSMFSSGFGDALGKAQTETSQMKDADMDEDEDDVRVDKPKDQPAPKETIEAANPAEPPKLASPLPQTTPPQSGGLFGTQAQSKITPAEVGNSKPAPPTWSFGNSTTDTLLPREIHVKGNAPPPEKTSPKIKAEPESSDDEQFPSPPNEEEVATPPVSKTPRNFDSEGSKTPEAPLPPESTSKASFAPGDSSSSSKSSAEEVGEPPLPPDPFPSKSKLNKIESASAEPPLPPNPFPSKSKPKEVEAELADRSVLPDDESDEGLDDEGSGVDVAQEFSSPSDQNLSPKISPDNSFSFPKSPTSGALFSKAQPAQAKPSLFGEVDRSTGTFGNPSAPFFPPPTKTQQSPRSPSPVRQSQLLVDSLRPDSSRSVSAPGPMKAIANRKAAMNQLSVPLKQSQPSSIELRKQEDQRAADRRAKQAAEEEQSLSDDEDEQVRCELETPVPGSRSLDPFLAHQDYVGNIDKPGIPGQIEKVYRDINSMIDTLGLNARSLTAFVKGHTEQIPDGEILADDLEHDNDFALNEIPKLISFEEQLSIDLSKHRFQDVQSTLSTCRDIRKDMQSLHHKRNDMTRAIEMRNDPALVESALSAPLSLEQASQQNDLRKKFAHFQRLLAQAEETITMFRAKLASCESSRPGSSAGPPQKKPTVEAVTKTILKLTGMVEKKSGDIDVLEAQLRSLHLPSIENGQSSREGSPFAASSSRKGLRGGVLGKSLQNGSAAHSSPLRRSLNSNSSPKKGPDGLAPEEVQQYRLKVQRRREVNAMVRQAFEKSGPRIRTLE